MLEQQLQLEQLTLAVVEVEVVTLLQIQTVILKVVQQVVLV